jgi:Ca-activated chloride channel family protein
MTFTFDFARNFWLFGLLAAAVLALSALALWARKRQSGALARLGAPAVAGRLMRGVFLDARTNKAVVFFVAFALVLLAIARPSFDTGERTIPATKLDVVIVLDYSKSMYARDVEPSRIARAKAEVSDLVRRIPRARFGAVAFAGEAMSFPLTSDSQAVSYFFSQLTPMDMPVGGTATARALGRARELFERDPRAKDHERVIVLVTDGEDLEGDPVAVAETCKSEGTKIHVVQVGSAAPVPIPELDDQGRVIGTRRGEDGKPLTTELTKEGEAQLRRIAETTGGKLVTSTQGGSTGIDALGRDLARHAEIDLVERVEVLYEERYAFPLALALALLLFQALMSETDEVEGRSLGARILAFALPGLGAYLVRRFGAPPAPPMSEIVDRTEESSR